MNNQITYELDGVVYKARFYYPEYSMVYAYNKMVYIPRGTMRELDTSLVSYDDLVRCLRLTLAYNLAEVEPSSERNAVKSIRVVVTWQNMLLNDDSVGVLIPYDVRRAKW